MDSVVEKQCLRSMTGYASMQGAAEGWTWNGEIKAVNGRSLDLRFRLPDIEGLEAALRKMLQARLARGNVTINLKLARDEGAQRATVNTAGLNNALAVITKINETAKDAGITLRSVTAADIAGMRDVLEFAETGRDADVADLRAALLKGFEECLATFDADRAREGRALCDVLADQIARVEGLVADAAVAVGDREAAARANLERGLARILETTDVPDETRLMQELAILAVKTDITEELDRLTTHIQAARDLLQQDTPIGRKFDFLMQEFNRETNTLCSKSQSSALTAIGLDLKSVIDQMREQVQNIE